MRRYRNGLIYLGLCIILGGIWVYVSAWQHLAWPMALAGSLAVAGLAQCGEWAAIQRLDRPKRARRRMHARPTTTTKGKTL